MSRGEEEKSGFWDEDGLGQLFAWTKHLSEC